MPLASAIRLLGRPRVGAGAGRTRAGSSAGSSGVDFESAVGPRELDVAVEGLCGDRHSARRTLRVLPGKFPVQKLKVAPAYVEPPESELDRIREDKEKVGRVWGSGDPRRMWDGPFVPPVDAPARDNFGSRRVFNGKPRSSP